MGEMYGRTSQTTEENVIRRRKYAICIPPNYTYPYIFVTFLPNFDVNGR